MNNVKSDEKESRYKKVPIREEMPRLKAFPVSVSGATPWSWHLQRMPGLAVN
jgi:hypothetical protein